MPDKTSEFTAIRLNDHTLPVIPSNGHEGCSALPYIDSSREGAASLVNVSWLSASGLQIKAMNDKDRSMTSERPQVADQTKVFKVPEGTTQDDVVEAFKNCPGPIKGRFGRNKCGAIALLQGSIKPEA